MHQNPRRGYMVLIRRGRFVLIAGLLACLGLMVAAAWHFWVASETLRIATGPVGGDGQKFLAAFVRTIEDTRSKVRLKLVPTVDREASAKALAAGEVDLAVVRSDELPGTPVQAIAILRRDLVGIVVPPQSSIETVRDLTGKTIGLVQGATGADRILDQILTHYELPTPTVRRVTLALNEITPAIRQKRVAAIFAMGPLGPGAFADAVTAVAKAGKGAPDIVSIDAAEAIAKSFPVLTEMEIAPGAFGRTPPKSEDENDVRTLGVTLWLVARSSLSNYTAGGVAHLLFSTKAALASTLPQVGHIEAPDPEKDTTLPVHPGAAAYFDGQQLSLLDQYEGYIYLVVLFASLGGSGLAWMMGVWSDAGPEQEQLHRLLTIVREVPNADLDTLEAFDREVGVMNAWALERAAQKAMKAEQFQLFSQVVTQVWHAIDRQRAMRR